MKRTFGFTIAIFIALTTSSMAQSPSCSESFAQISELIDQDVVSGVAGGIRASTVNALMNVQNNCYMNIEGISSDTLVAFQIPPNTPGGLATWPVGFTPVAPVDASGTIASTGAYQTVFAQKSTRSGCAIQNNGTTSMIVRVGGVTLWTFWPGQLFYCNGNGVVITSLIEITGTATQGYSASSE